MQWSDLIDYTCNDTQNVTSTKLILKSIEYNVEIKCVVEELEYTATGEKPYASVPSQI